MDTVRLGSQFRALRIRKDKRQLDVAEAAGLSRALISRIERGHVANVRLGDLERAANALDATLELRLRWHGEALDRLLDEDHARIVDLLVAELRLANWEVIVEASFSIWGERGSVDILARHEATGLVLVIEVKSVVPDSQATLFGLDRKARLAPQLAGARGWECRGVARILAVGDSALSRRRIARLGATYEAALPTRGHAVRRWLRHPAGPIAGLLFVAISPGGSAIRPLAGRQRVRRRRSAVRRPSRRVNAPRESVDDRVGGRTSPGHG